MPKDRKIDIKIRSCYICLSHTASDALMIDNGSPWLKTYKFCFGVTMCLDGIPKQICGKCRFKLQDYSDFKKVALRSENLWKCVIRAKNTNIKFEKSNERQKKDENKSDEDNHFNDDNATYVVSDDEYDDSVNNTQEITDNTTSIEQHSDTCEIMCYCGCTFDTEKKYNEHLDDCINLNKDLDTASLAKDNVPKSTSYLIPEPYKIKSRKTLKRKVQSHQKVTVKRKMVKKNTDADTDVGVDNDHKFIAVESKKKIYRKKSDKEKKIPLEPDTNTLYSCGLCEETFVSVAELNQHLTDHSEKNDLYCLICEFTGRDFGEMLSHRFTHLPNENKYTVRCHICKVKFQSKYAYMWVAFHYRSKHLKEKGGWCTKCDKRFNDFKRWRVHEFHHENTNGSCYICDLCGKRFLYRHGIAFHLRKHNKDYSLFCEICGHGFYLNCHLQSHIQLVHNNDEVKCTHCDGIYKNSLYLEIHMKDVALGNRYQCDSCSKSYRFACDLKSHQIWHSDERKFECKICGAAFKSSPYLKVHMSRHAGYRKYKCDQCTSCFTTTNELKRHLSVHTGVRRYKCNHCARSYHEKKSLLLHLVKCRHRVLNSPKDASNFIMTEY